MTQLGASRDVEAQHVVMVKRAVSGEEVVIPNHGAVAKVTERGNDVAPPDSLHLFSSLAVVSIALAQRNSQVSRRV